MTNQIAPQEDQIRIPASWAGHLLPRRGRDTPEVKLDPDALDAYRTRVRQLAPQVRSSLQLEANRPWADDAQMYLLGKPNPRGAAAVHALLPTSRSKQGAVTYRASLLRPALDAWVAEFGLAFATAAAVERLSLLGRHLRPRDRVSLVDGLEAFEEVPARNLADGIPALRGLLAGASDEEYAAAVAAVAPLRHEPARRMVAALLLPEETAWTDAASADYSRHRQWRLRWNDRFLWHWVRTAEQLNASKLTEMDEDYIEPYTVGPLIDGLGVASLPVLARTLNRSNASARRLLLTAIAGLPCDEAMAFLLSHLHEPEYFGAASTAVGHFPVRALRHVAGAAASVSREQRLLLAGLAAMVPAAARDHLDENERAAIEELLASNRAAPEADAADLPPLLVAPPWTRKRAKRKAVVIEGLEAPVGTFMVWGAGEQERWREAHGPAHSTHTEDDMRRIVEEGGERVEWYISEIVGFASADLAAGFLHRWDGSVGWGLRHMLQRILARFETDAADRGVDTIAKNREYTEALLPIRSVAAARVAADRLGLKSTRPVAAAWFDRHGADAATLLVPDALGSVKALREAAETGLAYLRSSLGPDAVRDAAKPYGAEAFEAIGALMDADPLDPVGVKVPKPGAWANAAMLPQVLMAGRETALPAASVPHLVTVLAMGTREFPYAGVDVVAEACDRESLRRFSWALFEQWIAVGAPAKDGWAFTQLVHFADDETVSRLTAMISEWPGESQHKRATTGLQVLGAIGTETALRAIHGISQKVKFKALKKEAGRQIEAVAAGLGLSTDQLADRLVPDFGLDDASSIVLDYGPRQFRVAFDETLKPFVTDLDGTPRKHLPKPGAKDDDLLADAARKRFNFLKKELRTVAADLVTRLESAMIQGRTWTELEFRRHVTDHPLVKHLAPRLVWMFAEDGRWTAFRVAEDRTYSDLDEDERTLPEDATIRLAHPILLGDQASEWAGILADYEILQPFEQLGRPVMALTETELATGSLARFEGATVEVGRLLGMTKRGWERDAAGTGGIQPGITYPLPGAGVVAVTLDPGIDVGRIGEHPEQTLTSVRLEFESDRRPADPVAVSEALAGLARLTGKS
jgi:hypothetical protein